MVGEEIQKIIDEANNFDVDVEELNEKEEVQENG